MHLWYSLVDILLPFGWLQHGFMKNALLGVLLVTPIFGLLGTMIVNNKMAFFSDSLGHSALTGIAIGVILGIKNPVWSILFFSVLITIAILVVKEANTASTDTIIGVFSSTAVALGLVILSHNGGFNKYSGYLIGDLLSISSTDLLTLGIVFILVILLWVVMFNKLLLSSMNPSLARSRGIKVKLYEYLFTLMMAVIVTISIQWVGILIISSLLIIPAAASRNIAKNMRQYHVYSVLIALISGLSGLILSYFWGTATGATIVLVTSGFFALTFIMKLRLR
ncbi:metal ABC transporter permease [Desulfosporosinus youngiae]|uniref:ABC-type Mn2+/Zn2+ transport system, permease component n=1 Tax=Desulfosporosinus youngiae DSM 17734 TaxID=768710 RepID=H5XS44_9FIRM|nr:metal ABC transporter permease [Desulfosporosinus youngiae]EHQ87656.1 ABC-type Mn2+/Zn2+ transport system, permease component [Desulfosporosinus youngiae DSM 17734]